MTLTTSIDITKPDDSDLQTQDLRDNFSAIQDAFDAVNTKSVANKAAAVLITPTADAWLLVGGTDGGLFKAVTGASAGTYSDNGGSYCGTQFIPTGGDGSAAWVRVDGGYNVGLGASPYWYGAVFDDTTDDTTAIQATLNNHTNIQLPVAKAYVTTLVPQNNTTIAGIRNADYLTDDDLNSYIRSTNAKIFDVTGTVKGVILKNITISGDVATSSGITGGGQSIQIENCQIKNCLHGIGDATNYGGIYSIINCHINSCSRGIRNLIDSHILNNYIYDNTSDGIRLDAGANDVSIIGNKIEWNGGYNLYNFQSGNMTMVGNILDRSTDAGIYLDGAINSNIVSNVIRRSCAGEVVGRNAHIYMKNCEDVTVANNSTRTGDIIDSPPSGTVVPDYVVIDGGANTGCQVHSNSGIGEVDFLSIATSSGAGIDYRINKEYHNRVTENAIEATITASGGTHVFELKIPIMPTYSRYNRKLFITVRDTNATTLSGEQQIVVVRETAAASVLTDTIVDGAGTAVYSSFFTHGYTCDYTTGIISLTVTNNRTYDAAVSIEIL